MKSTIIRNNAKSLRRRMYPSMARTIIPRVISQPVFQEIFRFRATSALTSTIFTRCFYNLLHMGISSGTSYGIIGSFKINKVRAYTIAEGGSGTELNTVAVTFLGGLFGKNEEYVATGSSAMPGVIEKVPPVSSTAGFWHSVQMTGSISGAGEPLLFLNSQTTGVIIDIDMCFTLIDGTGYPPPNSLTTAGAANTLYTNNLDNSSASGAVGNQNLFPVGRGFLAAFG